METEQHEKGIVNPNSNHEDDKLLVEGISCGAYVSPSSSHSSSLELDIDKNSSFNNQTEPHHHESQLSGNEMPPWSMLSASPPSGSVVQCSPEPSIAPPPMGQTEGYDPNRIPAHVFTTKGSYSNLLEWSSASNESLFSIHMGNNSFTQEFGKSGELMRLDDWNNNYNYNSDNTSQSQELSSNLPPVMEVPRHEEYIQDDDNAPKVVASGSGENVENHVKDKIGHADQVVCSPGGGAENNRNSSSSPRISTSNPRLSDESGHSGHSCSSFAFPVLVDAGKDTSLGVGVMDKHEKPNGKYEKYKKPETLEKPEKIDKPDKDEQPQLEEEGSKTATPKANSKNSTSKWFSWFSCWPRCC